MKIFDTDSWNRKSQYEFFKTYDDPFFNLTTELEVSNLYKYCKKNNLSFFLTCLYFAVESANKIVEFRLRIVDDKLFEFETIDIGSTILNKDNSFSFCYFKKKDSVFEFDQSGKRSLQKCLEQKNFDTNRDSINLI